VSPLFKKECREITAYLGRFVCVMAKKISTLYPRLIKMKRNINSNKEHRSCRSVKYMLEVRYVSEAWKHF